MLPFLCCPSLTIRPLCHSKWLEHFARSHFAQVIQLNSINYSYMDGYKDSQKTRIKKKTKTPRITDEGWNSQKQLPDPVDKKMKKEKRRKKRLLYLHSKLSLGLVPLQALLQNRHIACRKMVS